MRNLIYFELGNIIKRRELKLVILLLLIVSIADFWVVSSVYEGYPSTQLRGFYDEFILVTPYSPIGIQIYTGFLFIIIVSLVYSDSLIIEKNNNISNYIYTRTCKSKHIIAKIIVSSITIFIITASALALNYILVRITFPNIGYTSFINVDQSVLGSKKLFEAYLGYELKFLQNIYFINKDLYIVALIIFKSLAAASISVFTIAISTIINQNRMVLILIVSIIINIIPIIEELIGTDYMLSLTNFHIARDLLSYIIMFVAMNIASYVIISKWIKKIEI